MKANTKRILSFAGQNKNLSPKVRKTMAGTIRTERKLFGSNNARSRYRKGSPQRISYNLSKKK